MTGLLGLTGLQYGVETSAMENSTERKDESGLPDA